jgi:catechol 2,3-dioxygenase-like lactoylglutathione lyase family enzyme
MIKAVSSFSGISVNSLASAKDFYVGKLALELKDETMGLQLALPGGGQLFIYEKSDHVPATFTALNFVVEDIDEAVDHLASEHGIKFEIYTDVPGQDEKGIARGKTANMGPDIAWFKDPAGNILAVLES